MSATYVIFAGALPGEDDDLDDVLPTWNPLDAEAIVDACRTVFPDSELAGGELLWERPGIAATVVWEPEADGHTRQVVVHLHAGDEAAFGADLARALDALLRIAARLDGVAWSTFSQRPLSADDVDAALDGRTP